MTLISEALGRAITQLHPDAPPPRKPPQPLVRADGEINECAVVTFAELRKWLGESRAGLLRLCVAGIVPRLPDGRFLLKEATEAYLAHWRTEADAGEASEA